MKEKPALAGAWARLSVAVCLALLSAGCFRLPPIEVTVPLDVDIDFGDFQGPMEFTIEVGTGDSFDLTGEFAGFPIPDQTTNLMPLEMFPTEAEIRDLVEDEAVGVTLEELDLTEIGLVSVRLHPTQGDFSTITQVALYFVPKPLNGVAQPAVLLGTAFTAGGFTGDIRLAAALGVNLMQLIRANDSNPAPGYPSVYAQVNGTVPESPPTWDTSVVVTANGRLALQTDPIEFCDFPTEDEVIEMIREYAGGAVANMAVIIGLDLLEGVMTANQNDFSDFEAIRLFYVPKPAGGIEQPAIELGQAENPGGFGDEILLEPPDDGPVDFLEILRENDSNPSGECPQVYMAVSGNIPQAMPTWSTQVTLNVHLALRLF